MGSFRLGKIGENFTALTGKCQFSWFALSCCGFGKEQPRLNNTRRLQLISRLSGVQENHQTLHPWLVEVYVGETKWESSLLMSASFHKREALDFITMGE